MNIYTYVYIYQLLYSALLNALLMHQSNRYSININLNQSINQSTSRHVRWSRVQLCSALLAEESFALSKCFTLLLVNALPTRVRWSRVQLYSALLLRNYCCFTTTAYYYCFSNADLLRVTGAALFCFTTAILMLDYCIYPVHTARKQPTNSFTTALLCLAPALFCFTTASLLLFNFFL